MITIVWLSERGNPQTIGDAGRHLAEGAADLRRMLENWKGAKWIDGYEEKRGAYTYRFISPDQWSVAKVEKLNHKGRVIRSQLLSMEVTL